MKKVTLLVVGAVFCTGVITSGSTVFASEINEDLTKNYEINWDDAWDDVDVLDESTNFGSSSDPNSFGTRAYGDLATGNTSLSSTSTLVKSTGTTKGKILSTVTSATTSLRNVSQGYTASGSKKTAVGKFTATSELSLTRAKTKYVYTGLTIHTATNTGILYDSRTLKSGTY